MNPAIVGGAVLVVPILAGCLLCYVVGWIANSCWVHGKSNLETGGIIILSMFATAMFLMLAYYVMYQIGEVILGRIR